MTSATARDPLQPAPLARAALPIDAVALARFLIGSLLVRVVEGQMLSGRIVETEAYLPDDPASHSFKGETARNKTMFGEAGRAYVYRIYGAYWCLNVSAGQRGEGAAVLIRALEPLTGLAFMQAKRPASKLRDLLRGPGRICQAMAIDNSLDGADLTLPGPLYLSASDGSFEIGESVRIGLTKGADAVLRFYARQSSYLSGRARLNGGRP